MKTQARTSTAFTANKCGYIGLLLSTIGLVALSLLGFFRFDVISLCNSVQSAWGCCQRCGVVLGASPSGDARTFPGTHCFTLFTDHFSAPIHSEVTTACTGLLDDNQITFRRSLARSQ